MTNADRIRAMSDEELAVELDNYICRHVITPDCAKSCSQCKLEWLRKEADNG